MNTYYSKSQSYRRKRYNKKLNYPVYDLKGNTLYYESIDNSGNIIKHYQTYDRLNRRISYKDSNNNYSEYIDYGNHMRVTTEYDIRGNIIKKLFYYDNYTLIQDYINKPYDKPFYEYYSIFINKYSPNY